jgi:hypothetical protein
MDTHWNNWNIFQIEYMNLGKITLITPPDKLFNMNLAYLLIKPSNHVKEQFQTILSQSIDDLNVFVFDNDDTDISWLLSIAHQADCVIIDIDNCDVITQRFATFILAQPNAYYITSDEITPYNLISKNRIYNLDWIVEKIKNEEDEDDGLSEE